MKRGCVVAGIRWGEAMTSSSLRLAYWRLICVLAAATAACGGPDRTPPVDLGPTPFDLGPPGCTSSAGCADAVHCTTDTCEVATGVCRHIPTPALCGTGQSCDPINDCVAGAACAGDPDCADTNACTTNERCDPAARVCVYQPLDGDGDGDPPRVCGGTDCDDSNASVYLGAAEACNGRDDDCDGTVDEGATAACGTREACVSGTCECVSGTTRCAGQCADLTSDPLNCGACGVYSGASCTSGVGACARTGTQVCTASALTCSVVAGSPSTELCNGLDDDCDGTVDDGLVGCVPPRCAPRVSGDTRWAQYPMPGTSGHAFSYQVTGAPGAETVIDCVTGLEWQRAVDAGTYTQAGAVAYCDGLTLAGYTDWRLPSRIELVTLVDYAVAYPGPTISVTAFPGTPGEVFWSASSAVAGSPSLGWYVAFNYGYANGSVVTDGHRARCVR